MELNLRENLTISNALSFLRIFLIIPVVFFIHEGRNDLVIWIALFGMLTDWLDGFLARQLNQISELGKILDPVADKITIGGTVIALYFFQDFPLWLMLLIVLRDVFILFGALFIYEKHQQITASNWPGKVAVFFIALAILVFLAGFKTVFEYAVILAMLSLLFSALMYGKVFFKSFYEQRKS